MNLVEKIKNEMGTWLKETRHWFHQHPEVANNEIETANKIAEILNELGCSVDRTLSKTSIVATLKNGNSDKTIGLRSDMDGLPITEKNDLPYTSLNKGKMHACGHDGHIAMLLGAAKYFSENKTFNGTIVLIFQCAEEIGEGAAELIKNGLFSKYKIDCMFALHGMSDVTTGSNLAPGSIYFYEKEDAMMAAVKLFEVNFKGKGGHGSEPEYTIDPIPAAIEYINSIYYIKNRNVPSKNRCVLSVCNIASGSATAANIIPDHCMVKGTLRTVDLQTQQIFETKLEKFAALAAEKYNLSYEYKTFGTNATINNKEVNALAKKCALEVLGENMVGNTQQVMGGEDFSLYGDHTKISLAFISTGDIVPIHNDKYNFGDVPVPYGVSYYIKLVETVLNN